MLTHFMPIILSIDAGAPFPVIEIVKLGINKARGIEQVRQFLNIDRNNIIAFGDEDNDIEMIEYARHGVAMENGLQELKDVANNITFNNNEEWHWSIFE